MRAIIPAILSDWVRPLAALLFGYWVRSHKALNQAVEAFEQAGWRVREDGSSQKSQAPSIILQKGTVNLEMYSHKGCLYVYGWGETTIDEEVVPFHVPEMAFTLTTSPSQIAQAMNLEVETAEPQEIPDDREEYWQERSREEATLRSQIVNSCIPR